MRLGKNEEGISLLMPFEGTDPENLTLEWTLGTALMRTGHTRDGIERVDRVAANKATPDVYSLAAETHCDWKNLKRRGDMQTLR